MTTSKIFLISFLFSLAATRATAVIVTFDDLPANSGVGNGYNGFNWSNFNVHANNLAGYTFAAVSGANSVYNANGLLASFGGGLFDLNSAWLTAAWNDNLQVQIVGKVGSTILYSNTYTLSATAPTLFNFNYLGIDSVQFTSFGGTPHGYTTGSGTHFAMDNVTLNQTSVPDSGSTSLLSGATLLVIAYIRRKLLPIA
jgi:hypothetical protein